MWLQCSPNSGAPFKQLTTDHQLRDDEHLLRGHEDGVQPNAVRVIHLHAYRGLQHQIFGLAMVAFAAGDGTSWRHGNLA